MNAVLAPHRHHPTTPVVTDTTRRDFLGLLAAAGLLVACGSDDDRTSEETRSVPSDNGPIEVPARPQRVVAAVGSFETDMVAVGVMPVLTTTFAGPWVTLSDSVTITSNIPPTPEELLAAQPDLIVGWNWVSKEAAYEEVGQIAPYVGLGETEQTAGPGYDWTVPFESWDTLFLSVADAVGKRAEGVKLVEDFNTRLDGLAAQSSPYAGKTFARIEFYETGTFSHRGLNEDTAELMRRAGLTVVGPEQSVNTESLERLPEIDADYLIVAVGGDMDSAVFDEVQQMDVFQAIPAVQNGNLVVVDGRLWSGLGHLWARAVVDDLEARFF